MKITMERMYLMSSFVGSSVVFSSVLQQYIPYSLEILACSFWNKLTLMLEPYINITIYEYRDGGFKKSEVYTAIQNYLTSNSSAREKCLKLLDVKNFKSPMLSLDNGEQVTDEFLGVKLWWFYTLTFHKNQRELITGSYFNHVIREGKSIAAQNRKRKLYSSASSDEWWGINWVMHNTATFETLALEPTKKQDIINDLVKFRNGKEYYTKVGKAWKRGYLLYGPPGTGKSTMIVAMANFLNYDVYNLELIAVKDNSELRKLLIDTSNKSIIVIEDIDCSIDLTGQRKKEKEKDGDEDEEEKDHVRKTAKEEEKKSNVTLSRLLNFIDGIWPACGGERLIVFTTNNVEKLDPALIRRGRMDKHIELSYCCFEAFKVLAKNYLDVEWHNLFSRIECLLGETNMTPADVSENLMPKSDTEDVETCLKSLIEALEKVKEEARKMTEGEAKLKAEKKKKLMAKDQAKMKATKKAKLKAKMEKLVEE
ncbi:hypothetical protein UlMin_014869 [Ulmus minor]